MKSILLLIALSAFMKLSSDLWACEHGFEASSQISKEYRSLLGQLDHLKAGADAIKFRADFIRILNKELSKGLYFKDQYLDLEDLEKVTLTITRYLKFRITFEMRKSKKEDTKSPEISFVVFRASKLEASERGYVEHDVYSKRTLDSAGNILGSIIIEID